MVLKRINRVILYKIADSKTASIGLPKIKLRLYDHSQLGFAQS